MLKTKLSDVKPRMAFVPWAFPEGCHPSGFREFCWEAAPVFLLFFPVQNGFGCCVGAQDDNKERLEVKLHAEVQTHPPEPYL